MTLQRKVGFEAEFSIPSLGPSHKSLKYTKGELWVTDNIESFLDGGVPYNTDIGGKGESIRLDSDHSEGISRGPIIDKLRELGYLEGAAKEPKTKVEFVTEAQDELAPKSNAKFRTQLGSLRDKMNEALTAAKSGKMKQLGPPAKPGYYTGIPIDEIKFWLDREDVKDVEPLLKNFQENQIADEVYLQATVGIIPSGVRTFMGTAKLPGGKVALAPPSDARQQILDLVEEVVTSLEVKPVFAEHEWVKALSPASHEAFMGLLSLAFMYLLGDTLHQTTGGTAAAEKNAVPFLIKRRPWNLTGLTATHGLRDNPPPQDVARGIGLYFTSSKYLKPAYWIESEGTSAKGEGKLKEPLEARKVDNFITGNYVDFVESMLTAKGNPVTVVIGKELPGFDALPTKVNEGDVDVKYESYNQDGIPMEYRFITKRYPVSELLSAMGEIITEVRTANMKELSEEQKVKVNEAIAEA